MKRLASFAAAWLLLAASLSAHAQDGYVTVNLNLRAAPDVNYPRITTLPAGTPVTVQGCIDNWQWCDVIAYGNRGWVAGDYIDYVYQNRRVPLVSFGARIGVPIVSFVIGDYWGRHYTQRPFYRDRDRWYQRPIHQGRWDRHDGRGHDRGRDHGRDDDRHRGRDDRRDHRRDDRDDRRDDRRDRRRDRDDRH